MGYFKALGVVYRASGFSVEVGNGCFAKLGRNQNLRSTTP